MAEIRSAHRLMQEYQRHLIQMAELRRLLRERLDSARTELDIAEIEWAVERMDRGLYGTCRWCCALLSLDELRRAPHKQECAACRGHHRMTA